MQGLIFKTGFEKFAQCMKLDSICIEPVGGVEWKLFLNEKKSRLL